MKYKISFPQTQFDAYFDADSRFYDEFVRYAQTHDVPKELLLSAHRVHQEAKKLLDALELSAD